MISRCRRRVLPFYDSTGVPVRSQSFIYTLANLLKTRPVTLQKTEYSSAPMRGTQQVGNLIQYRSPSRTICIAITSLQNTKESILLPLPGYPQPKKFQTTTTMSVDLIIESQFREVWGLRGVTLYWLRTGRGKGERQIRAAST